MGCSWFIPGARSSVPWGSYKHLPACLYVCLSIFLSVYLSVCLSACLSVCLPACLSFCLPVCLPARLSVFLSIYLPACIHICLYVWLPVCLSACLSACLRSRVKRLRRRHFWQWTFQVKWRGRCCVHYDIMTTDSIDVCMWTVHSGRGMTDT